MFRLNKVILPIRLHQKSIQFEWKIQQSTESLQSNKSEPIDESYQYIQRTEIPMLRFQPSLPRLPIPDLEKTCQRYLAAVQPIVDEKQYETTKDLVGDFQTSIGPELQTALKEYDSMNKHTSYISEPWFNMYLSDRQPLPINYNPTLIMKHDGRPEYNDQLIRSTNIVISAIRFMNALRNGFLEPEVYHMNELKSKTKLYNNLMNFAPSAIVTYLSYAFKAYPLDMSQYQGLFGATRIPEIDKDRIYRATDSKHIVVLYKGRFFSVEVLNEFGLLESPTVILARLKYIIENGQTHPDHCLGYLTTENRNVWAKQRSDLIDNGNGNALETIDSALFCLSLDGSTYDETNPIPMVKQMLCDNADNRWFDKSLSIIVSKDGTAAINFEHSWGDGVAVLRFFNEIYSDTLENPYIHPTGQSSEPNPNGVRSIDFNLTESLKIGIETAKRNHEKILKSFDMNIMIYENLNKQICKQKRVSPDSVMQLGFQLAFYKQYKKFVPTYESCSTAAFRHGRTETIRPCTMTTKLFCQQIVDKRTLTPNELRTLIDQCSKNHGQLVRDAAMGQGFDRHLFGLKITSERLSKPLPAIYQDRSYQLINQNVMSTSTLSSKGMLGGAFGPVVKDGYGIGYFIQDELVGAIVTNYSDSRNGKGFVEYLRESYDDINKILAVNIESPA